MADQKPTTFSVAASVAGTDEVPIIAGPKRATLTVITTFLRTVLGIANDPIFSAAGGLIVGSGNDTAVELPIGTVAGKTLVADPNATNKASIGNPFSVVETYGVVTGSLASTIPRYHILSNTCSALITQRLFLQSIWLPKGFTVSNIIPYAGGTNTMAGQTHQWAAFFSSARVLRAISADYTNGAWGPNTPHSFAMTTPYTTTVAGHHYVGLMIQATTLPFFNGNAGYIITSGSPRSSDPIISGLTSDTGLTDVASCPSTTGTITSHASNIYVEVS